MPAGEPPYWWNGGVAPRCQCQSLGGGFDGSILGNAGMEEKLDTLIELMSDIKGLLERQQTGSSHR